MACCKCCCGNKDCAEGDEGKCCCGGAGGTCCQEGQYCCDGVCENDPCGCDPCAECGAPDSILSGPIETVTAPGDQLGGNSSSSDLFFTTLTPNSEVFFGWSKPIVWKPGYPAELANCKWYWAVSVAIQACYGSISVNGQSFLQYHSIREFRAKVLVIKCSNDISWDDVTSEAIEGDLDHSYSSCPECVDNVCTEMPDLILDIPDPICDP